MSGNLTMYMVAPKGKEYLATVVVADNEESARDKVREYLKVGTGSLVVLDLTQYFKLQGFKVAVTIDNGGGGIYH